MNEAVRLSDEDWLKTIKSEERYTPIPLEYKTEWYSQRFTIQYLKEKYNGDIWEACKDDPVLHAYYLNGYKLRDYQGYMMDILVKEKFVHAIWGRRMGKSLEYKLFTKWAMHWNKYPQGGDKSTKVIVLAHTADSAESYIAELNDFIKIADKQIDKLFKGQYGSNYFSKRLPLKGMKGKKVNQTVLQYYNVDGSWSSIEVYPPTTRPRGRPASIIMMDELAFWIDYAQDEHKIYREVVRPIVTDQPNCKVFGATTPNGAKGLSYELMDIDEHKTIFKTVWFPFYYRDDPVYIKDIREVYDEYKDMGALDSFRQEYMAELVSTKGAYFETEEVDNVFDHRLKMFLGSTLECHAAVDFGGSTNSRSVITVAYRMKGQDKFGKDTWISHRIYHKRYALQQDSTLQADMLDVNRRFNISKWHLDSQGGGSSFYAWADKEIGRSKIDKVSFRAEKVDMFRMFKIACFQGRVKSYYDREFMDEFNAFTANLKPAKGYTDDMLDSFVMCVKDWVIQDEVLKFRSHTLPRRGKSNGSLSMVGRKFTRK